MGDRSVVGGPGNPRQSTSGRRDAGPGLRSLPRRCDGRRSMRVLIVDPQTMFAEAIQVALRVAGERDVALTDTAEDALQALQMAPADIVFLGIGLPGLSAFLVGQEILRRWPGTH